MGIGMILQVAGTALLLGGYMPQIIKLRKTKNPTGISTLFWVLIAVGATCILVNMHLGGTPIEVRMTQVFNAVFAWYTLFLVMECKKNWKGDIE
ncbi:PQ-loop repeat-containing protein [Bacillus cereus]|uniref:PQ-loop repeat-containing protein n=1 Tax=Bacillus cereus TaxID=1396 RepID=UPI003627D314